MTDVVDEGSIDDDSMMMADDDAPAPPPVTAQEQAESMAEVNVMANNSNDNRANRVAEEAVLGAGNDAVPGFEVTDESGLLVQQRFVEFLGSL